MLQITSKDISLNDILKINGIYYKLHQADAYINLRKLTQEDIFKYVQ